MTFDHLRAIALMPELGPAWPLAFVLADMLFRSDGKLFPSIDRLCARTGFSRAQVKRHLATLRKLGILIDTGDRYGKTGRIHAYELRLPPLGALRKKMNARITEAGLSGDVGTRSNGLTGEPVNDLGNGRTDEPIEGGKWAHLLNDNGLICSREMGSLVSHISSKSKQKKQAGRCSAAAARARTRKNAPPSASAAAAAAALPDDGIEHRKPGVRRSKKPPDQTGAITAHLREYGISAAGRKAQAVVEAWASDPRVSLDVLDVAIARLAEKPDVRRPMGLLPLLVEDLLFEREHPIDAQGEFQPSRRADGERFDGFGFDDPEDPTKDDL